MDISSQDGGGAVGEGRTDGLREWEGEEEERLVGSEKRGGGGGRYYVHPESPPLLPLLFFMAISPIVLPPPLAYLPPRLFLRNRHAATALPPSSSPSFPTPQFL